jgi:hypothetical protein
MRLHGPADEQPRPSRARSCARGHALGSQPGRPAANLVADGGHLQGPTEQPLRPSRTEQLTDTRRTDDLRSLHVSPRACRRPDLQKSVTWLHAWLCTRLHAVNGDSTTSTCSSSCSGPTSRPTTRPSARSSIGQLADAAIGQGLGDRRGDRRTAFLGRWRGTGPTGSRPCRRGCGDECVVSAVAVRRLVIRGAGSPPRRAGRGRSCGAWRTRA